MGISKNIQLYWNQIYKIAYENYKLEVANFQDVQRKAFKDFQEYVSGNMEGINGLVYLEEGVCKAFCYTMCGKNLERSFVRFPNGDMVRLVRTLYES